MKIPKRQLEWQHGRFASKQLLTAPGLPFHKIPFSKIHIANKAEGAPFIAAPQDIGSLSISHRDTLAVAAYTQSNKFQIGIDLEKIEPRSWSFIDDFFTAKEAAHVRTLPESLIDLWVTVVWSAKEAVLKAWQKGLRLDTRRVEILPENLTERTGSFDDWMPLKFRANITGFPDCWLFWQQRERHILTFAGTKMSGDSFDTSKAEPPELHLITEF